MEAQFTPDFAKADGLITCVTVDATDGEVLMVAYMNAEAFNLTLETGKEHYWSRSRNKLWKKGESSGNMLQLVEMRVDCDLDAVVVLQVLSQMLFLFDFHPIQASDENLPTD